MNVNREFTESIILCMYLIVVLVTIKGLTNIFINERYVTLVIIGSINICSLYALARILWEYIMENHEWRRKQKMKELGDSGARKWKKRKEVR
jgi:hypothetical protein